MWRGEFKRMQIKDRDVLTIKRGRQSIVKTVQTACKVKI